MENIIIPSAVEEKKSHFPNLYIPGAGKSGTSSLHEQLRQHPNVNMSAQKEPHFWTSPNFLNYTTTDVSNYLNLFQPKNHTYFGESSTGYMAFPNFIDRIKTVYPSPPKFIFLLRNPIDRAYSHYWWLKGMGSETKSFKDALLFDINEEPTEHHKLKEANYKHYFQFGLYGKWISRFISEFGREHIHIITTEELKQNNLDTLNSCFIFLELNPIAQVKEIKQNTTVLLKYPTFYKIAKKIAWNQYKGTDVFKRFVPKFIKKILRERLYPYVFKLTSTNKKYPKLTEEERVWLKNLYQEDINLLKRVTNMNFEPWTDFNVS